MVIACLDELGRGDVVEVIREEEEEKESPQVDGDGSIWCYSRWWFLDRGDIDYRGQDGVDVDTCADAYHNLLL